jgi:hypothetical protein
MDKGGFPGIVEAKKMDKGQKYARVIKVHVGTDGKVRSADIEYRLPGETRYRTTTRPIHKLVLIIPMEEQTVGESEEGAVNEKEAQETKADEPPQAGDIIKDNPSGKKGVKNEQFRRSNTKR